MTNILEKPFTNKQRADFVCEHQGLNYYEDDSCVIMYDNSEIIIDGEAVPNPNYEQEQASRERHKIDHLSLTKREFLLALYNTKNIKPSDIKNLLKNSVQAEIEFEYSSAFYRGNPLFNQIGALLGVTPEELDNIFISLNNSKGI